MNDNNEQQMDIRQSLRDFIIENFLFGEDQGLTEDTSFLENGIIDSMGFLELISYLESTHGIQIADHELVPDNMDSITNVSSFLIRKLEIAPKSEPLSLS